LRTCALVQVATLIFLASSPARAQASEELREPGRMLRGYLTRIASGQLAQRKEKVARIRTKEEFEARRAEFRTAFLRMIGGLPAEHAPLNARTTGTLDRGDYLIEKIVFESLPKFFVTANLYIPQTGKGPYPAVLHPIGHSLSAKARAFYQTLSLGLVKQGFVVLTYDPLGQGERRLFYDEDLKDSKVGGPTTEHEMVGIQSLLAGESIARYMIWDGMRGLDLLESRPEVDRTRLGITGCSGGGTLTTYIAALDDRLRVAAPACYISSWEDQLQAETGPQDAEQQFPNLLKNGYDHGDFVTAFAPKPYLICSTDQDFFPLEGARRTFEEARRIYGLFGASDRIDWFHEPGGHGTPPGNREAIYGWMIRWLRDGPAGPAKEPKFQTEPEEAMAATPTGQVATWLGGETASSLNLRRFATLAPRRPVAGLRDMVIELTHYEASHGPLNPRTLGSESREGYRLERIVCETGPGRLVPGVLALPEPARDRRKTALYLSDARGSAAFTAGGDADQLARHGYTVFGIDVSGRGETASIWRSYSEPWFGRNEKEAWLALMVGRTLVSVRADDILRGLDLLAEKGLLHDGRAAGFAKGLAAVDLLHAAVIDPRFSALALEEMLVSYQAVARAPVHRQIFDAVVPGVLGRYDLPDLVAAQAPKPVWLLNARSPAGPILLRSEVQTAYESAARVYASAGAPGQLRIGLRSEQENVFEAYPEAR
jgi:dienelactone hydrolase